MENLIDKYYNKINKSEYSVMITGYSLYAIDNHFNLNNAFRISQENINFNRSLKQKSLNTRLKLL